MEKNEVNDIYKYSTVSVLDIMCILKNFNLSVEEDDYKNAKKLLNIIN